MSPYRVPPKKIPMHRFSISINEDIYESIKSEAATTKRSMASVFNERLRRDSLINEIREVIRQELNRKQ
jgi:hypothetical protein